MPKKETVPEFPDTKPLEFHIDGRKRVFDVDDAKLPDWIRKKALTSADYPYRHKMPRHDYEKALKRLQVELVKLQAWMQKNGSRVMALFEGRDAAGKGGTIFALRQYMNPRTARNVALPKPTERESGQWYFQRYVTHFPTEGEFVTFDRSWYNRGVVEPVMGFCTPEQHQRFLEEAPHFERMIVNDGIHFFKFWLDIGQEMQLKRFHDRRHDPLKTWKFSPIDIAGMGRWDAYGAKRDETIRKTHTAFAPWAVVKANDKRRARLAAIRRILLSLPYADRDLSAIGDEDPAIIGEGAGFLAAG
ncbi:MAG: polyphosphate kinase 2 [Rhizobiaceae bacterium]|nr:MAG: polyphosphate kinase 2 [Rhizobiaceae bacterium]